jgi:DNA (cytosine-5)-methyltransferase 1
MPAHHINENESSFSQLPTPRAQEPGSTSPGYGDSLNDVANRWVNGHAPKDVLPTPKALDGTKGNLKTSQERLDSGHQVDLPNVAIDLAVLPTPLVDDAKNTGHNQTRIKTLASEVWETERTTNWGKFEPAIRRWESLTRPAPAPTLPDGKDGAHRLSSLFTEWMMGLPLGWITGHGLKRADELKMAGNGVVPQQAELALRFLLGQIDSPKA